MHRYLFARRQSREVGEEEAEIRKAERRRSGKDKASTEMVLPMMVGSLANLRSKSCQVRRG